MLEHQPKSRRHARTSAQAQVPVFHPQISKVKKYEYCIGIEPRLCMWQVNVMLSEHMSLNLKFHIKLLVKMVLEH